MANVEKYLLGGSAVTLMTTELNSLGSSTTAGAISSVGGTAGLFNNTVGGGSMDGYTLGLFELVLAAPGGTLTAGSAALIWFLGTVDATNYEDGSASVIPARSPDLIIPVRVSSGAQRILRRSVLPPGNWYVLLSQATGQTWGSSGNTLKVMPATYESV